jgi:hypothetical protein
MIERMFGRYQLAAEVREAGFSTRLARFWAAASGRPLIGLANTVLGIEAPLTIHAAPSFTIGARKL